MRNESKTAYMNIPRISIDVLLVASSWIAAEKATRFIHPEFLSLPLLWMPILFALALLTVMNQFGIYDITAYTYPQKTLRGVITSCVFAIGVLCLMLPFHVTDRVAIDLLSLFSLCTIALIGVRYFLTFPPNGHSKSTRAVHTLFVGDPESIRTYMDHLEKTSFRLLPIGYLADIKVKDEEEFTGVPYANVPASIPANDKLHVSDMMIPLLGEPSDLIDILDQNVVDEVVLTWNRKETGKVDALLNICASRGVLTRVVLDVWQTDKANNHIHSIGPLPVVVYHRSHLSVPQQFAKRFLDVLFGLLGLLGFAFASLVLIPMIRLSCKGPVFVLIARVGRNGRLFNQLRYRIHQEGHLPFTRSVEEMTGIGRFLYHTRLQYLPSFWNVLIGNMSLVGTRGSLSTAASRKVGFKPGLTGLWHVWDFDRLLDEVGLQELDDTYAANWSLWLDIRILLQTPVIALIHRIIGHMPGGEVPS